MIAKPVKIFKFVLGLTLLVTALMFVYRLGKGTYQSRCDNEIHLFRGEEYVINLCAIKSNLGASDTMRIQVYSKDMELLVDRVYEQYIKAPPLSYTESRIEYIDWQVDGEQYIEIPPTKLDWIKARIP